MSNIKNALGLSLSLAKVNFKLRNEGSYLGILWYLLNPVLSFMLLLFVFSKSLGINIPSYPIYLLIGIIMFNFFSNTVRESTKTMIENRGIIKSINFPKESFLVANVLKNIFSHVFEIIILISIVLFFGLPLRGALFYPLVLFLLCFFVLGFSLLLSALTVYFVDLENIWSFISILIWVGTPIFYTSEKGSSLFYFNLFNPLYYFITIAREIIIYNKMPELWLITGAIGYSLLFFIAGLLVFNKLKSKFAELI